MDDQEEYLIAYANLKSNLIVNQKNFLNPFQLKKFFYNINRGFPICLPDKIKYFDYTSARYFRIDKKIFGKKSSKQIILIILELKNFLDMEIDLLLM